MAAQIRYAAFPRANVGNPVVMGRKTYQSIGQPLPGRTNIVISRDGAFSAPGVLAAPTLEAALAAARGDALRRGIDAVMVVGGAEIYAQAMPLARPAGNHARACEPSGGRRCFLPSIAGEWRETARRGCAGAGGRARRSPSSAMSGR